MNGFSKSAFTILAVLFAAGCAGARTEIMNRSQSERTDVFSEVSENAPPAKGLVDLTVKASVKTHVEGRYLIESSDTLHGALEYPFVLNIDGQAVTWIVSGKPERTPHSEKEGEHAEGGDGVRYELQREIRLKPGAHTVFFALPGEDVSTEITVNLREGRHSVLEIVPVYRRYRYEGPRFDRGVDRLETHLKEKPS